MRAGLTTLLGLFVATAGAASGEEFQIKPSYGLFGTPGLIDMPTAESAPDAELALTSAYFAGTLRNTLTFQILPRLSGSFRYSTINDFAGPGTITRYDRSFDLRFRFLDEGTFRPAVAVGFQDFIGTGVYSAEYFVATKSITPRLKFSGGVGWGRLGSYNGFTNPLGVIDDGFERRPTGTTGQGGVLEAAKWFRGDMAVFAGVEWRATDRLTFKAEYSSDAYVTETGTSGLFTHASPFNFSASYQVARGAEIGAYYLYGSTVGVSFNFTLNPKEQRFASGLTTAPVPVAPRAGDMGFDVDWAPEASSEPVLEQTLSAFLQQEGMILVSATLSGNEVRVLFRNERYNSSAQAVGRVARILTNVAPAPVEIFTIVPVADGMALSSVTMRRTDVEALEHAPDGAWQMYGRAMITEPDALGLLGYPEDVNHTPFTWSIAPYLATSTFDPDDPIRADFGLELKARFEMMPGLFLAGTVRKKLAGNLDQSTRASNSVLPKVRTDFNLYDKAGDPAITDLTFASYFRPGANLYGRLTTGYLERMYGGVSAELLWKPVSSRFALGAELNYARQRGFDTLFDFQTYDIVTGHVSGYWDIGNGFHAQVDAGRYLAGDWGGTLTLEREFKNGWRVGAFATFTDVSFRDFGEGSFDKGLLFTIPLETLTGNASRTQISRTLRPITRDGGARLEVDGRLYEMVREYHEPGLTDQWGRFWR